MLTISGERKSEHQEGSEAEGNLRLERSYGSFMRRFRLPENVDTEGGGLVVCVQDCLTHPLGSTDPSRPAAALRPATPHSPNSTAAPALRCAGIKAVAKEGVLRLTVPKTEESKPKQIDVQVSE